MNKKDYVAFAKVFRDHHSYSQKDRNRATLYNSILRDIMKVLEKDNPNFKQQTFINSCIS